MDIIGTVNVNNQNRIQSISSEVLRRSKARRDFVSPRSEMKVSAADGSLVLGLSGQDSLLSFRRGSLSQLATSLEFPLKYLNRLEEANLLPLAAHNLNELLKTEPKRHLVRTLDGKADAILSDRYRALDNSDLLATTLQELKRAGAQVWDLRLTDDDFRLLAVSPHIMGEIRTDRQFTGRWRWEGKEGDAINAGVTISNSETGKGGLSVRPSVMRGVCQNFCVWADGVAQIHLGGKAKDDGEVFYTDDTKRQADKVLWMRIRDTVAATFDPKIFAEKIAVMNAATQRVVERPTEAVEASITAFGLPLERKEAILSELLGSGDTSQYGLSQALTAQANPLNAKGLGDAERSAFEDAGGLVMELSENSFAAMLG